MVMFAAEINVVYPMSDEVEIAIKRTMCGARIIRVYIPWVEVLLVFGGIFDENELNFEQVQ
jgi:hypothetical protein